MAINWRNPDQLISKYFSVREVTQGDPRRIPAPGSTEEQNILLLAKELDKVRAEWGSAIGVTSWYRPTAVNREVGGVSNSQHINGGAADIYSADGRDQAFESFFNQHWGGAVGYGVAAGRGFTHVDLRGGGWRRGAALIRWNY